MLYALTKTTRATIEYLRGPVVGLRDEVQEDLDDVTQELAGVLVRLLEVLAPREQS